MHPHSRPFWFWAIPINIVVIALIAVFILVIDEDDAPAPAPVAEQPAQQPDDGKPKPGQALREPEDPYALGNPQAPVAMVVFTDYQCQYCAKYAARTEPKLIEDFVNTAALRIEWRDVDFFGKASNAAARAAWAAGRQNQYIEYHHTLFAEGDPLGPAELTHEKLVAAAQSLNMDIGRFEADLASDEAHQQVRENAEEAASAGAFSTPSFIINGQTLSGAQPYKEFEKVIEDAAAAAEKTGGKTGADG